MKTGELINTYHLEFVNKVEKIGNGPTKIDKWPESMSEELTEFLYVWSSPEEIDTGLLPDIENILNGTLDSDYTSGNDVAADLSPTNTILHRDYPTNPLFTLPTQDFYDIIVLWRDFLLEEPRNGTVVKEGLWSKIKILFGKT